MIDHNHPAVEAVAREIYVHDAPSNDPQTWPPTPTALADDYRGAAIAALTAALPHLVSPDDPRPWEPLAPGDPLHAGDEVWRWWCGVSTRGTFDVQHPDSQVYTAERGHLGHRAIGTWYVRRAIQELPTEDGVEIVPAGGGPIGAAHPGGKFTTHHATYDSYLGSWVGVWRAASGRVTVSSVSPGDITPGTWKVASK